MQAVDDFEKLTSKVKLYFRQQAELYGEDIFLLGVQKQQYTPGAAEMPVLNIQAEGVAPKKRDASKKDMLESLYSDFKTCKKCDLSKGRAKIVFGSGSPFATVLFIGEAPGSEEDQKGLPFVGAAGQILERMLKRMGFTRKEIYITNIVKCHPPQNRNPLESEITSCGHLLEKQLTIIQPKYIFCLGKVAANTLLKTDAALADLRNKVLDFQGIKTFVTYHPAALLRDQELFWDVFKDMKLFRRAYDSEIGDKPPMVDVARIN